MNNAAFKMTFEELLAEQRPRHDGDLFSARHPKMDRIRRAKAFAPFDALRGFDAAIDIARDTTTYVPMREMDEEESAVLNDKLCRLAAIFRNNKRNHRTTTASIHYFVEKAKDGDDLPIGEYETLRGDVTAISPSGQYLFIDAQKIMFREILDLVVL